MIANKNILIGLILAALLIVGNWLFLGDAGKRQLPNVTFNTLTGEKITSANLKGHPALITFWATDCPGCIAEIPHLIELYNELSGKGLIMISVAMHYDPPDRVLAMTKAKKLPYPVALDPMGKLSTAFYNVQLTPTNFLIAPDGTIALQKIGEMDMSHVRTRILKMLEEG
ncbi:MAG: TlpA family protein disulfide reductase [Gammaproteobacteria bacterium]|nr:MAG: TlpA family protein disulfide reductase [Gammaproteobacteria bacterium]